MDERADSQRIGSISALGVTLKEDPSELVGKEVVAALHEQGINATLGHVSSEDSGAFPQVAEQSQAAGVLAIAVKSIKVASFDALMDPPTATVTLEAPLYDRQGSVVERESATGRVQRRVNTFAAEKSVGELVAEATHDAAQQLVSRGSLTGAITRFAASQRTADTSEVDALPSSGSVSTRDMAMETAIQEAGTASSAQQSSPEPEMSQEAQ
jgi:hypothetical protein